MIKKFNRENNGRNEIKEKEDKEWIQILENLLENFLIRSSKENYEEKITKDIIKEEFNEKEIVQEKKICIN